MNPSHKRPWSKADDDALLMAPRNAAGMAQAAKSLNRSVEACKARLSLIRNSNRPASGNDHVETAALRERDIVYVARCMVLGGFPRAVVIDKKKYLVDADGREWIERRAA